jgi:hypothetical protein
VYGWWGMTAICILPETAGWGQKCEMGGCHGEAVTCCMLNSFVRTSWHVP